jgi:hypothetical protein
MLLSAAATPAIHPTPPSSGADVLAIRIVQAMYVMPVVSVPTLGGDRSRETAKS